MIYWDHNATSPLRPKVKDCIKQSVDLFQANPNSMHMEGQRARSSIEGARKNIAEKLGCEPSEIVFTGSATEANLIALWGLWLSRTKNNPRRRKILSSPIEHASVFENLNFLSGERNAELVFLPCDKSGRVEVEAAEEFLRTDDFAFCTTIGAHNETGVVQDWEKLGSICRKYETPFHSDLVQCVGRLPLQLSSTSVDAATISFHKIGGPKALGILFLKKGLQVESIVRGGSQERKRRAGTENILSILAAGVLVEELNDLQKTFAGSIEPLRNLFESKLSKLNTKIQIVGVGQRRLPNTSYVLFEGVRSDAFLMNLDLQGVCASSGSACSSGMILASRALVAMGYSEEEALSGIRFSLGPDANEKEVVQVASFVEAAVLKLVG